MLYQLTAYELLDGLQVQVTTARTDPDGYQWEHRILEHVRVSPELAGNPWDVLWTLGQLLCERALERGSGDRR